MGNAAGAAREVYNAARDRLNLNLNNPPRLQRTLPAGDNAFDPPSKYAKRYKREEISEALKLIKAGEPATVAAKKVDPALSNSAVSFWKRKERRNRIRALQEQNLQRNLAEARRQREAAALAQREAMQRQNVELRESLLRQWPVEAEQPREDDDNDMQEEVRDNVEVEEENEEMQNDM